MNEARIIRLGNIKNPFAVACLRFSIFHRNLIRPRRRSLTGLVGRKADCPKRPARRRPFVGAILRGVCEGLIEKAVHAMDFARRGRKIGVNIYLFRVERVVIIGLEFQRDFQFAIARHTVRVLLHADELQRPMLRVRRRRCFCRKCRRHQNQREEKQRKISFHAGKISATGICKSGKTTDFATCPCA